MPRNLRSVDDIIGAGMIMFILFSLGGIVLLESAIGGPISRSIGKAIELSKVCIAKNDKISESGFCRQCEKELSFFTKKWYCRACRASFCLDCNFNNLTIVVKKSTYQIKICNKCYTMIDSEYDRNVEKKVEEEM